MAEVPSSSHILEAIADEETIKLLRLIATSNGIDAQSLRSRAILTRKQYYTRMASLSSNGLILSRNGKYYLTLFGKVIYALVTRIGAAIENIWKLQAIDGMETSADIPEGERDRFIQMMVVNPDIRQTLIAMH